MTQRPELCSIHIKNSLTFSRFLLLSHIVRFQKIVENRLLKTFIQPHEKWSTLSSHGYKKKLVKINELTTDTALPEVFHLREHKHRFLALQHNAAQPLGFDIIHQQMATGGQLVTGNNLGRAFREHGGEQRAQGKEIRQNFTTRHFRFDLLSNKRF